MIITHTINGDGHRRIYLGGRASVECWIEPAADGVQWSFHMEQSGCCYPVSDHALREWAKSVLLNLSTEVGCAPTDLKSVAFDRIAALHVTSPLENRRMAVPSRQHNASGFVSAAPQIKQPRRGPF